jgi:hypothetical protein
MTRTRERRVGASASDLASERVRDLLVYYLLGLSRII